MQSDVGTVLIRKWFKDMHMWYCDNIFVIVIILLTALTMPLNYQFQASQIAI